MNKKILYLLFSVIITAFIFSSCSPTKNLKEDQYLLTRTKLNIEGKKKNIEKDEIKRLIGQQPNKKFLGLFRLKMWLYYKAIKGKDNKFNRWLKEKAGEPPAIYDPKETTNSANLIKSYLNNIGYFNSEVDFKTFKDKKKKTIKLTYDIELANPYLIKNISYKIPDPQLKFYMLKNSEYSLIHNGDIYNAYKLEDERERITKLLKNRGYYYFNKEYIYFEADTTVAPLQLDITTIINNIKKPLPDQPGKFIYENHKKYFIRNIFINTNYNPMVKTPDSLNIINVTVPKYKDPNEYNHYFLIYHGKPKIRPHAITQSVFINTGEPFVLNDVQQTYRRLTDIQYFNYADIQFNDVIKTTGDTLLHNMLDCRIKLSRARLQSFTIEVEGTNTGGDLGIGGNLTYRNKNIFRGGEILSVRFKGAMEVQRLSKAEDEGDDRGFLFFNTAETGVEAGLYFPRFLVPVSQTFFPKYFKPKTTLNTSISYQRRPKYKRYLANISFGYDWSESKFTHHILTPLDFNSVKVYPTPEFDSILNNLTDERLKNQYTDHLIPGLKYSLIFNNQNINKLQNFIYFRGNLEIAGNLLNAIGQFVKAPRNENGKYTLFNIQYAQFVKTDLDFRYYWIFTEDTRVAFRGLFGIGIPYGNSDDMPFEKGFYGGGSNGMRGWRFRMLGPGSYNGTGTNFDRMGDIKIELNAEYRFPIYKFFKSAFFVDAGNIWLLKEDKTFPGGKFEFSDFAGEIAVDAGLGFRFDFGFFVFRIDGAIPIRNPALRTHNRWTFNKITLGNIMWNFGIGYPF